MKIGVMMTKYDFKVGSAECVGRKWSAFEQAATMHNVAITMGDAFLQAITSDAGDTSIIAPRAFLVFMSKDPDAVEALMEKCITGLSIKIGDEVVLVKNKEDIDKCFTEFEDLICCTIKVLKYQYAHFFKSGLMSLAKELFEVE